MPGPAHTGSIVIPPRTRAARPSVFDFVSDEPPLLDQGSSGTCCSHSSTAHYYQMRKRLGLLDLGPLSRLMLQQYTNASERRLGYDGKDKIPDKGCSLTGMMYTAQIEGVVPEKLWPYSTNLSKFPPAKVLEAARQHVIRSWSAFRQIDGVYVVEDMLQSLADRRSFVLAFTVWDNLRLDSRGVLTAPPVKLTADMPGHGVSAFGFDDTLQAVLCRNSWGAGFGLKGRLAGHFYMPYSVFRSPYVFDVLRVEDAD